MPGRRDLVLAGSAAVVVVAVLGFGFHLLGPPRGQRAISADERRVSDLRTIAQQLNLRTNAQQIHARQGAPLPATLEKEWPRGYSIHLNDPLTNVPYEYHPRAGTAYELCAVFETASAEGDAEYQPPSPFWQHAKGRRCFELDAGKPAPW